MSCYPGQPVDEIAVDSTMEGECSGILYSRIIDLVGTVCQLSFGIIVYIYVSEMNEELILLHAQ